MTVLVISECNFSRTGNSDGNLYYYFLLYLRDEHNKVPSGQIALDRKKLKAIIDDVFINFCAHRVSLLDKRHMCQHYFSPLLGSYFEKQQQIEMFFFI